jgi:pimeloyl-ACP methyl ester carboxylesterase
MRLEVIAKKPDGNAHSTPLVFVHGAWHGAWCWEQFQSYFAEQGYASYALNLRGHGNSEGRDRLRWFRATDYVDDIACVVDQLPRPPALIGHSGGGYLIQKYLESRSAAAAVFLASVSVNGAFRMFNRMAMRHPWKAIKAHLTMEGFAYIETPKLAREYFFSPDIPTERLNRYFAQLQSESYLYGWDSSLLNVPRPERVHKVPMLVLGAREDRTISCDEIEETASAYDVQAEFFPGMAHDMMLEKDWIKVAGRVVDWLREKNL